VVKNGHEDLTLKCVTDFFSEGAAKFFGVNEKLVGLIETETNHFEQKQLFADLVFLTEENTAVHFEFQSTASKENLYRFCLTDAYLMYRHNVKQKSKKEKEEENARFSSVKIKSVKTIVIYTGNIEKTVTELNMGSNNYKVHAVYMSDFDGDEKFSEIKTKLESGKRLTDKELLEITLLPLMKISGDRSEMIKNSVSLGRQIEEEHTQSKIMAALNMLAEKFVKDEKKLAEIREMMRMTRIAQAFIDEGIERGIAIGIEEGIAKGNAIGIEVGMEKGITIGIEEGRVEGRVEGSLEMAKAIARALLARGVPEKEVAEITGLNEKGLMDFLYSDD
jgi:predicted transposase/invertase (TIGR01784 family)